MIREKIEPLLQLLENEALDTLNPSMEVSEADLCKKLDETQDLLLDSEGFLSSYPKATPLQKEKADMVKIMILAEMLHRVAEAINAQVRWTDVDLRDPQWLELERDSQGYPIIVETPLSDRMRAHHQRVDTSNHKILSLRGKFLDKTRERTPI